MTQEPVRSEHVPVTLKMLNETKFELKSEILSVKEDVKSLEHKMDSQFSGVQAQFSEVQSQFSGMHAQFSEIRSVIASVAADVHSVKAAVASIAADVHGVKALSEEQNAHNLAVLDGYAQIYRRQEEYERRLKEVEGL